MDGGEPRYGYSRLSDYHYFLGTVHGIKDDLIIGTGSSDISGGGKAARLFQSWGPQVP